MKKLLTLKTTTAHNEIHGNYTSERSWKLLAHFEIQTWSTEHKDKHQEPLHQGHAELMSG